MPPTIHDVTILVPVDASDPGKLSSGLVELLGAHEVVILGYYPVPDQSAPDQLRSQFGEETTAETGEIASQFADRGAAVETVVTFTRDWSQTIDNTAAEFDADAVFASTRTPETLSQILVALRDDDNLERIVAFVGTLLRESDATVTIYNLADSEDAASRGEFMVRGVCDRLVEAGLDPARIEWRQERASSPSSAILTTADEFDLLVVGESEPSLRERILDVITNEAFQESSQPVLIVRSQ